MMAVHSSDSSLASPPHEPIWRLVPLTRINRGAPAANMHRGSLSSLPSSNEPVTVPAWLEPRIGTNASESDRANGAVAATSVLCASLAEAEARATPRHNAALGRRRSAHGVTADDVRGGSFKDVTGAPRSRGAAGSSAGTKYASLPASGRGATVAPRPATPSRHLGLAARTSPRSTAFGHGAAAAATVSPRRDGRAVAAPLPAGDSERVTVGQLTQFMAAFGQQLARELGATTASLLMQGLDVQGGVNATAGGSVGIGSGVDSPIAAARRSPPRRRPANTVAGATSPGGLSVDSLERHRERVVASSVPTAASAAERGAMPVGALTAAPAFMTS
jgi:hypothetical protein